MLTVQGDIDLFTAPQLRQSVHDLLARGCRRIVVDLRRVAFLDSTGLGVLVGALKRARDEDGDLVLVGAQRPVRRVLSVTGLDKIFTLYTELDEAVDQALDEGGHGPERVGDAAASGRG